MRFRTAILLGAVVLVAGIITATVSAVAIVVNRAAWREVAEELERNQQVFVELQGYRRSLFRSESSVVAEEPRLKAVVATEEITHETILGVAQEIRGALGCDLFLITDGQGRLLADVVDPDANGYDLTGNSLIAAALRDGESFGIWIDGGDAYQVQARRLNFGATVVGVLALGYRIDDRVASTVQRQTGAAVAILLEDEVVARSLPGDGEGFAPSELSAAVSNLAAGHAAREVRVGGSDYMAVAAPFPDYEGDRPLRYVILRSLDQALAPGARLTRVVLGVAAVALGAAFFLALALSRRLARPLDGLVHLADEVAEGKLDARAEVGGPVEVKSLGAAMNRMVGELEQNRRQLAMKERLEREMEIAMQIQTAILPRDIQVDTLEAAARMICASEVGGDYYDVLPVEGGAWIGIGDVAGHGLTAGLAMMMVQSIVSALTRQDPNTSPSNVINLLNGVMHDNIRDRLEQDEHVTLSLLRYTDDGKIVYAGAHEEILVCRASSGRCERYATPGTWLGAAPDISRFTKESEIQLHEGDLVVLYTDGITEARGDNGQMLGMSQFCQLIEEARERPVAEIRDHVIDHVTAWAPHNDDDVTLLVLRHRGA